VILVSARAKVARTVSEMSESTPKLERRLRSNGLCHLVQPLLAFPLSLSVSPSLATRLSISS